MTLSVSNCKVEVNPKITKEQVRAVEAIAEAIRQNGVALEELAKSIRSPDKVYGMYFSGIGQ